MIDKNKPLNYLEMLNMFVSYNLVSKVIELTETVQIYFQKKSDNKPPIKWNTLLFIYLYFMQTTKCITFFSYLLLSFVPPYYTLHRETKPSILITFYSHETLSAVEQNQTNPNLLRWIDTVLYYVFGELKKKK